MKFKWQQQVNMGSYRAGSNVSVASHQVHDRTTFPCIILRSQYPLLSH